MGRRAVRFPFQGASVELDSFAQLSAKFECTGEIVQSLDVVWLKCNQPPVGRDRFLLAIGGLQSDPQSEPGVGQVGCEFSRLPISGNRILEPRFCGVDLSQAEAVSRRVWLGDDRVFDQLKRLVVTFQLQCRHAA